MRKIKIRKLILRLLSLFSLGIGLLSFINFFIYLTNSQFMKNTITDFVIKNSGEINNLKIENAISRTTFLFFFLGLLFTVAGIWLFKSSNKRR